jgi:hypothetical protein
MDRKKVRSLKNQLLTRPVEVSAKKYPFYLLSVHKAYWVWLSLQINREHGPDVLSILWETIQEAFSFCPFCIQKIHFAHSSTARVHAPRIRLM